MPGGRNTYNPGLPGGGRTRYRGPDAYVSQQRENETRVQNLPGSWFMAPVWQSQTMTGLATSWFADLGPQTPDFSSPTGLLDEWSPKQWQGVGFQKFTFTAGSQNYAGYTPIIGAGFWHLDTHVRITLATTGFGNVEICVIPTRLLARTTQGISLQTAWKQHILNFCPPTATSGLSVDSSCTLPIYVREESAVFLCWGASTTGSTLVLSQPSTEVFQVVSYLSGYKIA